MNYLTILPDGCASPHESIDDGKMRNNKINLFPECPEMEIFCFVPLIILREDEEDVAILLFIKASVLIVLLNCKGNK